LYELALSIFLELMLAMPSEGFCGHLGQVYCPSAGVLGFTEHESAAVHHVLQMTVYPKGSGVKVYIGPFQIQRLAHSETASEVEDAQAPEPRGTSLQRQMCSILPVS
jgi:hypothetical protein